MCAQIVASITENWINRIMMKRLSLALAGLFAFVGIAQGAGNLPGFSLSPQFDLTGKIAPGCKLYVIQAGTVSTPQNSYQDTGLTLLQPNPLTCDAAGRTPQWFVADGSIKVRLTTASGSQIFVGDNLLVVGASSGGGGGSPVDPTTVLTTGDVKVAYGTGIMTGFVRLNGRTIGSATSGATERANSDVQALFVYLWGADANLAVSGGRGISAAADWAANKTITLPDARGRAIAGTDDMGNTAAGRLTSTYWGGTATTLGAVGGLESQTLTLGQLPTGITANGTTTFGNGGTATIPTQQAGGAYGNGNGPNTPTTLSIMLVSNLVTAISSAPATVTSNNTSGQAHSIASPSIVMTFYIKL